jgi:hypothetical protein
MCVETWVRDWLSRFSWVLLAGSIFSGIFHSHSANGRWKSVGSACLHHYFGYSLCVFVFLWALQSVSRPKLAASCNFCPISTSTLTAITNKNIIVKFKTKGDLFPNNSFSNHTIVNQTRINAPAFSGCGYYFSLKLRWTILLTKYLLHAHTVWRSFVFSWLQLDIIFTLVTVIINTVQWWWQIL